MFRVVMKCIGVFTFGWMGLMVERMKRVMMVRVKMLSMSTKMIYGRFMMSFVMISRWFGFMIRFMMSFMIWFMIRFMMGFMRWFRMRIMM